MTKYSGEIDIHFTGGMFDFIAVVNYKYTHQPAKLDGLWENCYPEEEDFEYDIDNVSIDSDEPLPVMTDSDLNGILDMAKDILNLLQENENLILSEVLELNS